MKLYGSHICSSCREAFARLAEEGTEYEFIDITANVQNLREFLHLRDTRPEFDAVKAEDRIGIPCFVEGDKITLG